MGLKTAFGFFVLMYAFVGLATADTITFTGTGGIAADGYYTYPYFGNLNGVPEIFMCVDDAHEVQVGDTWKVYVGSQADLSKAYYQGANAPQIYGEEFTLAERMATDWVTYQSGTPDQQASAMADIQFIQPIGWYVTNPGSMSLSADQTAYLTLLQSEDLKSGFSDGLIFSDLSGIKQEFVAFILPDDDPSSAPEPATLFFIGGGLVCLGVRLRRRQNPRK